MAYSYNGGMRVMSLQVDSGGNNWWCFVAMVFGFWRLLLQVTAILGGILFLPSISLVMVPLKYDSTSVTKSPFWCLQGYHLLAY